MMLERDQEVNIFDQILNAIADDAPDHDNQSMELLTNRCGILRFLIGSKGGLFPNPIPIIDVYGTRRGPKLKKDENGMPLLPPHYQHNTNTLYLLVLFAVSSKKLFYKLSLEKDGKILFCHLAILEDLGPTSKVGTS